MKTPKKNLDFTRIAIVNRGEPAMRLIHAAREYSNEHGIDLKTIALYTHSDRNSMFVREADEAFSLGESTFVDPVDGERKVGYLNYPKLEEVLVESGAEAVWAGWGFVAEHPRFVDLCDRLGIVFIGPSAEVMRKLGDKITSKVMAEKAGVPVTPWSGGGVDTIEDAEVQAKKIGYPLMVKATAGGGGRGIRKVTKQSELARNWEMARTEALKAFGDATVFLEKMVTGARHIEIQILADSRGTVWPIGLRDCTLQRRNQKVLEESPSPVLTKREDRKICDAAARLGKKVGYQNAGTVEFLFDPDTREYSFMEVNARLQVEHPISEVTAGVDMVKLQIHVARGGRLKGKPPERSGHAVEFRLNAEDPTNAFIPAPGRIDLLEFPSGPGLRIDTGVAQGDEIAPEFDSMIAKIITYGKDRNEAMARMKRSLMNTLVSVKGGVTNKGFLLDLLSREEIIDSKFDISWLDKMIKSGKHLSKKGSEIALVYAAIESYLSKQEMEQEKFFNSAHRGRPKVDIEIGAKVELGYGDQDFEFLIYRLSTSDFRVDVQGEQIYASIESLGGPKRKLSLGGSTHWVFSNQHDHNFLVEVDGIPHRIREGNAGVVRSPSPAVISSIAVKAGDRVKKGDRLAVLEAMKIEMSLVSSLEGTVSEVVARSNTQVDTGAPIVILQPEENGEQKVRGSKLNFKKLKGAFVQYEDIKERCRANLNSLSSLMCGFDVDVTEMKRIINDHSSICLEVPSQNGLVWERETDILRIFADIISLFRRDPINEDFDEVGRRSSEEYLFTYLSDIRAGTENLPQSFKDQLTSMLSHYGVTELKPGKELERALFRAFTSYQRMKYQTAPVLDILGRHLDNTEIVASQEIDGYDRTLERIISETRGGYAEIHDLAKELHFSLYTKPVIDGLKAKVFESVDDQLSSLEQSTSKKQTNQIIHSLVECPQPLAGYLSARFPNSGPDLRNRILEVMTRRFYRIRNLKNVKFDQAKTCDMLTAEYEFEGKTIHLTSIRCDYSRFQSNAKEISRWIEKVSPDFDIALDFYFHAPKPFGSSEKLSEEILDVLNKTHFSRHIRRIVAVITGQENITGFSGTRIFTYRQKGNSFYEDRVYRKLHPMMWKRLEIWRLENFEIESLTSPEDVYLFKGVAKDNPDDVRRFAFAEVRDLSLVESSENDQVHLPYLEMMLHQTAEALRRSLKGIPVRERPHWNRILLYIWPPLDLTRDELQRLINRLAPVTAGIGLEKLVARAKIPKTKTKGYKEVVIEIANEPDTGPVAKFRKPKHTNIRPLSDYSSKVIRLRRRGLPYPYQLIRMLTPAHKHASHFPPGKFSEYDFDEKGNLVETDRELGLNRANLVVGVITNRTPKYPEGMSRVAILSDPSRGMGNLAEPECARIKAALDLAEKLQIPVEWFAISAGAKIAMDSGTENLDWVAQVLRRLVEFTQAGGEVNVIVGGINVGAQPYWNAEATMLMHTKGILIMMPESAMVLTGKTALDYSGGVSAEDNKGIGGYERIMGPNGEAQYFAKDMVSAFDILFRHYEHTYKFPGERFPRKSKTSDPVNRDITESDHGGQFKKVGEIFSDKTNPGRKRPFEIRKVMRAVMDNDHQPLERWFGMENAEIAVIWEAHVGGLPVCMIGFESQAVSRLGILPADGPNKWSSGTLFPRSSKKIARAINAASDNRPVVVLANLSGFDGSPESLRKWQLEYGAEIGRAIVNFKGPIILCVISRYHGGAFVVFSNKLNDQMEVAALEGTYASVIGGAPAAAVVFTRDVQKRTESDPRVVDLKKKIESAKGIRKIKLLSKLKDLVQSVHAEKMKEVAEQFDQIHDIKRAKKVGSIDKIISPNKLRSYLVRTLKKGMARELELNGSG